MNQPIRMENVNVLHSAETERSNSNRSKSPSEEKPIKSEQIQSEKVTGSDENVNFEGSPVIEDNSGGKKCFILFIYLIRFIYSFYYIYSHKFISHFALRSTSRKRYRVKVTPISDEHNINPGSHGSNEKSTE